MGIRLIEGRDISWQDTLNKSARRHRQRNRRAPSLARPKLPSARQLAASATNPPPSSASSPMCASAASNLPRLRNLSPRNLRPRGAHSWSCAPSFLPTFSTASVMPVLRHLNPAQPNNTFRPIQSLVDHSVSPRKFFVYLVAIFAALGLILAALGIYGVISYSVTRQTQEIGIRMALGATPAIVQRAILSRTLKLARTRRSRRSRRLLSSLAPASLLALPHRTQRSNHVRPA